MLYESGYYKKKLSIIARSIEKQTSQVQYDYGSSYSKIEYNIFLIAHIINKLLNSNKLSDEFTKTNFSITKLPYEPYELAPNHYNHIDILNNHRWDEFYNTEKQTRESRKAPFICDQLRHSFCFFLISEPCETSNLTDEAFVFQGILFNSDQTKKEGLFHLEIEEFLRMIRLASSDDISFLVWGRGRDIIKDECVIKGEMNVVIKSKESTEEILNISQVKPNIVFKNT